ncbi:hypothetical protein RclHR1_08280006 [Rhizophagus clarus]|uniref:Uncharacterized protein n=1 Tax=Rhizophagus clarus TaxID=94130 RepID=A0A2Z6RZU6_9GLOM|nr:hypothetical protein RclHR1_08280006 [Rhizophagus clarus]GES79988.1 hypothetical protein GLOIN_2v1848242 [Rhizophagus clarus]
MPQADRIKRWESSELIKILSFLNHNFDLWYKNRQDACVEAVKAANIDRDGKSVYNKVHSMIKAMEHFLRTHKKPRTCFIIRENRIVRGLVKKICQKTKERNEREQNQNQNRNNIGNIEMAANNTQSTIARTSQNRVNVPQVPFTIETIDEIYKEQIKRVTRSMLISKEMIETRNREIRDLYEQISQHRSELINLIEKANDKLEKLKMFPN